MNMYAPTIKIMQVIAVTFNRGDGTKNDPVHEVIAYYDMNGLLLAEDSIYEKQQSNRESS